MKKLKRKYQHIFRSDKVVFECTTVDWCVIYKFNNIMAFDSITPFEPF